MYKPSAFATHMEEGIILDAQSHNLNLKFEIP
jgi:hypothetical protein